MPINQLEYPMQGYQPRYAGWQYVSDGSCGCDDCRDYRNWLNGRKPGDQFYEAPFDPFDYEDYNAEYMRVFNEAQNIASNDGGLTLKPDFADEVNQLRAKVDDLSDQVWTLTERNANQRMTIIDLEDQVKNLRKSNDALRQARDNQEQVILRTQAATRVADACARGYEQPEDRAKFEYNNRVDY